MRMIRRFVVAAVAVAALVVVLVPAGFAAEHEPAEVQAIFGDLTAADLPGLGYH